MKKVALLFDLAFALTTGIAVAVSVYPQPMLASPDCSGC